MPKFDDIDGIIHIKSRHFSIARAIPLFKVDE